MLHKLLNCVCVCVCVWDGHVVTKSDRWVSSGYSSFLPHEDHPNANIGANEHDKYKFQIAHPLINTAKLFFRLKCHWIVSTSIPQVYAPLCQYLNQ